MRIVTPSQMREIEDRCEQIGISKKRLMENAGRALAEMIDGYCRRDPSVPPEEKRIVFLAGAGNNGGDCFAAADILIMQGYRVTIINVGGMPKTQLAKEMYNRLPEDMAMFIRGFKDEDFAAEMENAELDFMTDPSQTDDENSQLSEILRNEDLRKRYIYNAVTSAYVLVDGVFGTGYHGSLDEETAEIFSIKTSAYRIAVDVASGGNSTNGTADSRAFRADETITFGFMKSGMTQYPLKTLCGRVTVADIGIPNRAAVIIDGQHEYSLTGHAQLGGFPFERAADSHKGTFGTVLIIAGSSSMRGAAAMSSLGALRSGAGLVKLASVEKCIDTVSVTVPEATFLELECDDYGYMLYDPSIEPLREAMSRANAIVIGCGMGVTTDTRELTKFVVQNAEVPVIIDADGINCIVGDIDILMKRQSDVILTPHPAEMARLSGCATADVVGSRFDAAEVFAEKYDATVVLKGAGTVIADRRRTSVNHTGNAGMSVGGSGDVLAGMIGAIAAQGIMPFESACAGAYLHGLAGDIAAEKYGQESMLPRDIISCLPEAFTALRGKLKAREI